MGEEQFYNSQSYCVQVGAFQDYNKAMELQLELLRQGLWSDIDCCNQCYKVKMGGFTKLEQASLMEVSLRRRGYPTLLVTN